LTDSIHTHDLALLIFSRSAKAESTFKVVAHTAKSNEAVSNFLYSSVHQLAKSTDLPYFIVDETKQQGLTFGCKLANAFDQLFAKGFEYVIAIGNDCPSLTVSDIKIAAKKLKENGSVVGPTKQNGAYLIGMSIATFDRERFAQLSWQCADTLSSLTQYFDTFLCTSYHLLSVKNDVNNILDWQAVLPLLNKRVKQIIDSILNIGKTCLTFIKDEIYCQRNYPTTLLLRGPPMTSATF
jgi:glycosyltransferase A (GT-A) superfamily protein (DUF2064 family)